MNMSQNYYLGFCPSQSHLTLLYQTNWLISHLPNGNNLASIQIVVVQLSYEYRSNSFIQCCAIHIDSRTNWKDKASDPLVNPVVLFCTSERDRQSGWADVVKTLVIIKRLILGRIAIFSDYCGFKKHKKLERQIFRSRTYYKRLKNNDQNTSLKASSQIF